MAELKRQTTRAIGLIVALLATSCGEEPKVRAAHEAERKLQIVQSAHGSEEEQCAAKREVERAWLDAMNEQEYRDAKLQADLVCQNAALSARLRL